MDTIKHDKKFFYILLAVSVFFFMHSYNGIRHDGILYMGQALSLLHPNMDVDPFLALGSQNHYTIFPSIYAFFIKLLSLNVATILLLIIGQFSFLASIFYFAKKFVDFRFAVLGIMAVAISWPFYGSLGMFSYAEAFLSARTFAEPLSIFGIAFVLDKKWFKSAVLLVIAFFIHPLIAIPALAIWWLAYSVDHKWAFSLPIIGFIFVIISGIIGVKPFNHLLVSYDANWWHYVKIHNVACMVSKWKWPAWYVLGYDTLIAVCGYFYGPKKLRYLFSLILAVNLLLFPISFIAGDLLKNVLIFGLQLWRAQWLLQLFAMLFLPYLVFIMWKTNLIGKILAIIATSLVIKFLENNYAIFFEAFLLIVFLIVAYKTNIDIKEKFKDLFKKQNLMWLITLLILIAGERFIWLFQIKFYPLDFGLLVGYQVLYFGFFLGIFYLFAKNIKIDNKLLFILSLSFIVFLLLLFRRLNFVGFENLLKFNKEYYTLNRGFVLFVVVLIYASYVIKPKFGMLLIVLLSIASVLFWDQRTIGEKYMEAHPAQNPFYHIIPPKSQVYFNDKLKWVWLLFYRPCYISVQDTSASLFDRKGALLFEKRLNYIKSNRKNLLNVCILDKNLGYIVTKDKIGKEPFFAKWDLSLKDGKRIIYLYDCQVIRRNAQRTH